MRSGWGKWAAAGTAIAATTFALSPAVSAVTDLVKLRSSHPVSLVDLGSISSFTPVTHDSRLAQAYARIVATGNRGGIRFTPTSGSVSGRRSITIAVRADGNRDATIDRTVPAGLTISPFAYNLGFARGLSRFTLDDSVGRKPLDPIPTAIGKVGNFSLPAGKTRLTTSMSLDGQRATGAAPQTIAGEKSYSVDVTSSYRLTRNIDVMAGVRYRGPGNRIAPLTDDRQDSQAVYVGTAFRF